LNAFTSTDSRCAGARAGAWGIAALHSVFPGRAHPSAHRRGRDSLGSVQRGGAELIPGEVIVASNEITLNADREAIRLMVANTGDRPVQVGSHYHFGEANGALEFDRDAARGMRLDVAAGTAVRFEPGQRREVRLIPIGGARRVFGFNRKIMGAL